MNKWLLAALLSTTLMTALPARAQQPFQPLFPVQLDDEAWSAHITPRPAPQRAEKPTEALRWLVANQPNPDAPVRLAEWDNVEAVRFRLHTAKAYPFKLNVLLTGSPGGYFMTAISLDFTGWKQFTLPIEQFTKVREADLKTVRTLSFRAQGYGQPKLDADMTLWLDDIEVQAKPGAKLNPMTGLETNRRAWEELAAQGNPYLLLNQARFKAPLPAYAPPANITSAWTYRGEAEKLVPVAYAAADKASPHRGRADLIAHAVTGVDWLVNACGDDGTWWKPGTITGDPNVNRFTLGPLLDAVLWLKNLPEGQAAWPRWEKKLAAAVELQRRAYKNEIAWDWGGLAGGEYANQDAYYVLIMEQAYQLWTRPADFNFRSEARAMMKRIADNLLPDGGLHYIGVEQEAPVYHGLNLVILARYATLSGDETCAKLLRDTANYWPLTLTAEGQPEYWSDVWWKQTWGYVWRDAVVIAAGATRDPRNQWLMWRALERSAPQGSSMDHIYAAPYWPGTAPGQALPQNFIVPDRNMRGLRGRAGQWYFGVTQGRGLRNTFVGGLITSATGTNPLRAAFRGAQIEVLLDEKQEHGLWLSEINDNTTLALRPDRAIGLGARYTLQKSLINGVPTPQTPASPWQVTQLWRAAGDGILGVVILEATADTPAQAAVGRLALGPGPVEKDTDGTWLCGPLRVKILQSFGDISVVNVPGYNQKKEDAWPGLELRRRVPGTAKAGERFVYAAWLGPREAAPPASFGLLPGDLGWVAQWPAGRRVATLWNRGQTQIAEIPWPGGAGAAPTVSLNAWSGESGKASKVQLQNGTARLLLPSGLCLLE